MRIATVLALLCSTALLAACGGDDSSSGGGGGGGAQSLKLTAEEPGPEKFGFNPKELSAKAGEVTLTLELPDGLKAPHAIELEGNGVEAEGKTVQAGGTSTVTEDLKAGTYTFYCPVADHREEGMEGTLTVK